MNADHQRIVKGFIFAPALTILFVTLFSGDLAIVILIIGMLAAYFCALVIGGPLYVLMRKFRLASWSWAMLGGALAALPFLTLYLSTSSFHVQIHGIMNSLFLTLIGVLGSLIFWFIAIRGSELHAKANKTALGHVLFGFFVLLSFTLAFAGRTTDLHGFAVQKAPSVEGELHKAAVVKLADGKPVVALLPKGYPLRANCPVRLISRRALTNLRPLYWIITYKDSFYVGEHWQNMTPQALARMGIKLPPANCKPANQPDD